MTDKDPDMDVQFLDRQQMKEEIKRLRNAIRKHRDSTGHELCWYHPELWNLLPEQKNSPIEVPNFCEFIQNCAAYRKSLERPTPDWNGFITCQFCGCKTNAKVRACCDKGREQDS